MTPQAYLYICDDDIDSPVLTHKKMDWSEKYPHWQEIPLVMAQPWVGLTDEDKASFFTADQMTNEEWQQLYADIEAKLKEKNT